MTMDTTAINVATTMPPTTIISTETSFPFTELPTELRRAIYSFALHGEIANDIANINAIPNGELHSCSMLRPKYHGAFALLRTSLSIRGESVREMLPLVEIHDSKTVSMRQAEWDACVALHKTFAPEFVIEPQHNAEYRAAIIRKFMQGIKTILLWALIKYFVQVHCLTENPKLADFGNLHIFDLLCFGFRSCCFFSLEIWAA